MSPRHAAFWLMTCACAPATGESPALAAPKPTGDTLILPIEQPAGPRIGLTVKNKRIECDDGRCRGEISSSGQIDFEQIDPATRITFGPGQPRTVVDRGAERSPRYRLEAPDLGAVFESQPLDTLLVMAVDDTVAATMPITLDFSDGATATAEVPFTRTALRVALFDRLKGVSKGPVAFPSDDAHAGPPRGMWVQLPLGVRGTPRSISELDWVLVHDEPSRSIVCERSTNGGSLGTEAPGKAEQQRFTVYDERARVYERRSGKLVGERLIASAGKSSCEELFWMLNHNIGGVIGLKDLAPHKQVADWAWTTLR